MTNALFSAADLSGIVHETVSDGDAAAAERLVWGWLSGATGLSTRPDTVTPDLFSWALELGVMAYSNPESLTLRVVDDVQLGSSEARRKDILKAAAQAFDIAGDDAPGGSFPPPLPWPDPVCPDGSYSLFGAGYTYGVGYIPS